jgi:hypothetical protein
VLSHDAAIAGYLLILRAKCERDGFPVQYAIEEERDPMTPNLSGIASTLAQVRHSIETQAQAVATRAVGLEKRASTAIAESNAELDKSEAAVVEIEQLNASLKGSNGGPTSAGSPAASASTLPEPQASWSGNKPA